MGSPASARRANAFGHARETATFAAVEPEVQRQRVRVAAREGRRVERGDWAAAARKAQRTLA